jgi:hypothetical protein
MRYLILLWGDEAAEDALEAEERRAIVDRHRALIEELRGRNALVLSDALDRGAKVVRDGVVTDGPFTETKEQVGGFYVVDVAGENEALEIARAIPASPGLVVQVSPIASS